MKLTSATLTRRRTHGPYEHEEIVLVAEITSDKDYQAQLAQLNCLAHAALYPSETKAPLITETVRLSDNATANFVKGKDEPKSSYPAADQIDGQSVPPVITEAKKSAPRRGKAAATETKETSTEATPSENAGTTSGVDKQSDKSDGAGVQPEAVKASAPVVGKGIVVYDANVKEMRSRFATYLTQNFPKWQPDAKFGAPETEAKAKYKVDLQAFSKNLVGKPFEDAKGNMLESFKSELQAFFG